MEDRSAEAMVDLEGMAVEVATNQEVASEAQEDSVEDIKVAWDMATKVETTEAVATKPEVVAMEAKVAHLSETTTTQSLSATSEMPINVTLRISSEVST